MMAVVCSAYHPCRNKSPQTVHAWRVKTCARAWPWPVVAARLYKTRELCKRRRPISSGARRSGQDSEWRVLRRGGGGSGFHFCSVRLRLAVRARGGVLTPPSCFLGSTRAPGGEQACSGQGRIVLASEASSPVRVASSAVHSGQEFGGMHVCGPPAVMLGRETDHGVPDCS